MLSEPLPIHRCRAGKTCQDAAPVMGVWVGKEILTPGLCPTCQRYTRYALANLSGCMPELSELLEPDNGVRYKDPDVPAAPRIKLHSPAPLRIDVLALQELVVYEVPAWAEGVADVLWAGIKIPRMPPPTGLWDPNLMSRTGWAFRVRAACDLLRDHTDTLFALGKRPQRARSLTTQRGDHPDAWFDEATNEWWVMRDGVDAALLFMDLDRRAEKFAGRHPGEQVKTPCPRCAHRALYREPRLNKVHCRHCHDEFSDDAFDSFMAAAYLAFRIDGNTVSTPSLAAIPPRPRPEPEPAGDDE